MMWGRPSLVTKSNVKEAGRFHSLDLEKAAYRLSISSYTTPRPCRRKLRSRSLPVPSLQAFLTRASAPLNKVSASPQAPLGGVIRGVYLEADLNKPRGNANHPQEDAYDTAVQKSMVISSILRK